MKACIFCKILRGELPVSLVLEEDLVVAFMDIQPVNRGHALVVPRRHVASMVGLTGDEMHRLMAATQLVIKAQKIVTNCEATTIYLADGEAAGQEVPHVHFHAIPRWGEDGFGLRFPPGYENFPDRADLDGLAAKLRSALR